MASDFNKAHVIKEAISILESGSEKAALTVYNGDPNGNVTATVGALCIDYSGSGKLWKNTNGSTAWEEIGSGSSGGSFSDTFTNSDLVGGVLTVDHGLSNQFCFVEIYDNTNKIIIPTEVTAVNSNTTEIDLTGYGTIAGTWKVIVSSGGSASSGELTQAQVLTASFMGL